MTDKKIALITGANKGIGFEIARGLGKGDVTVLVGARSPERGEAAVEKLAAEGVDARFVRVDVTDVETVEAAAAWVEAEYGRLDILVNNAGIGSMTEFRGTPVDTPVADVRRTFETNVFGVVAVTNAFAPLLERAEAGRIVNVSSEVGSLTFHTQQGTPYWQMRSTGYAASKSALNMVTVAYAKHYWDTAIKVNAITPGYCATDLNEHSGPRTAEQGAQQAIAMALIDADGPSGTFTDDEGTVPW